MWHAGMHGFNTQTFFPPYFSFVACFFKEIFMIREYQQQIYLCLPKVFITNFIEVINKPVIHSLV